MLNSLKSAVTKLFSQDQPRTTDAQPGLPLPQGEGRGEGECNPPPKIRPTYDLHLNSNRNGKIAHLPRDLRDRVCQCIYEGNSLTSLAEALNHLPEVKSVMAAHFDGVPVSQQNLSEWKAGGYRDWLLQRQLLEQKGETVADAQQLAQTADGLADSLFGLLTLDYAQIMMNREKDDEEAFEKKRAALSILSHDIVRLRRCHLQGRRVEIQEQRLERDEEKTGEQVVEQFAQWARHPDIRRIFFLEPQDHMRLLREKFGLPPTAEDKLLLQQTQNHPKSTPPPNPPTDHKPPQTENREPATSPVSEEAPQSPDNGPVTTVSPSPMSRRSEAKADEGEAGPARRSFAKPGEGELNSKLNPQNSTLPTPVKTTQQVIAEIEAQVAAADSLSQRERDGVRENSSNKNPVSIRDNPDPNSKLNPQNSKLSKPPLSDYEQALRDGKTHLEALYAQFTPVRKKPQAPPKPSQPLHAAPPPPSPYKPLYSPWGHGAHPVDFSKVMTG